MTFRRDQFGEILNLLSSHIRGERSGLASREFCKGEKTMRKTTECIRRMPVILLALVVIGCVGGQGKAKLEVPELGLSMELPAGWIVDRQNPRMCFETKNKVDNFGMVEDYSLEGQTLNEYVERMSKVGAAEIISSTPLTIGGREAVQVVTEALYTVIEIDVRKGDRVVRVSFRTLREDFPQYEPFLRKALQSVEIR